MMMMRQCEMMFEKWHDQKGYVGCIVPMDETVHSPNNTAGVAVGVGVGGGGGCSGAYCDGRIPTTSFTSTPDRSTPRNQQFSSISPSICEPILVKQKSNDVRRRDLSNDIEMAGIPFQPNRILSRNINGTIAMTSQPSNESELQLYRVLQRSNLLAYYDTFICQGGDDVQQLCEAGEEEFLEIMALVGMASKPLHVRRLQKALQEWMTNPAMFQSPIQPFPIAPSPIPAPGPVGAASNTTTTNNASANSTSSVLPGASSLTVVNSAHNAPSSGNTTTSTNNHNNSMSSGAGRSLSTPSPNQFGGSEYGQPCSPIGMTPVLLDRQIVKLAEAAECLVKALPPLSNDFKQLQNAGNKKRSPKEIETVLQMDEQDPRRMEEIRKFSAIYGRFDCKRKPEKPLTLHEVSVNEAAAQLCAKLPALLYRRDELFPLARQVVRESGYQYSKGHSRSQSCSKLMEEALSMSAQSSNDSLSCTPNKRLKLDVLSEQNILKGSDNDRKRRHDRLEGIVDQLKSLGSKQEEIKTQIEHENEKQNFEIVSELQNELDIISDRQMKLSNEKDELEKNTRNNDDNDSQFSTFSNDSSNLEDVKMKEGSNTPNKSNEDSCDRGSIKSGTGISDAIEEGLRMIKELNQTFPGEESSLEMRLFGRASSSQAPASAFESSSNQNSLRTSRPRGRPPKQQPQSTPTLPESEVNSFYEQIFSQAQLQQAHMLASYQAALAFGDLNTLSQNLLGSDGTSSGTMGNNDKSYADPSDKSSNTAGGFSSKSIVDDDSFKLTFV